MAKISFIIPVYNTAKYLNKCMDSVLNQTFSDLEIILVDDGSTDGSFEQARKASPLAVVSYPENRGKGYALRQGFKKALEEGFRYAMVFDADGQHTLSGAKAMIDAALELPENKRCRAERLLKKKEFPFRGEIEWIIDNGLWLEQENYYQADSALS